MKHHIMVLHGIAVSRLIKCMRLIIILIPSLKEVWKRNDSDEYVPFQLKLWKEENGKKEVLDTLKLYGKPGERISVSLLRLPLLSS